MHTANSLHAGVATGDAVLHSFDIGNRVRVAVLFGIHVAAVRRRHPVDDRNKVDVAVVEFVAGDLGCLQPTIGGNADPAIHAREHVSFEADIAKGFGKLGHSGFASGVGCDPFGFGIS